MKMNRSAGILLHPTSLPGPEGIGTLGKEAREFVDFLAAARQGLWQILPLGPTGFADSPYQCFSAFAGNPLLISLDMLKEKGWLSVQDMAPLESASATSVDYGRVIECKLPLLAEAYRSFSGKASPVEKDTFEAFKQTNADWLGDFAMFMALKDRFEGRPWFEWNVDVKFRRHEALERVRTDLADSIEQHQFIQYLFFDQWEQVKAYAARQNIQIIGDIPLYVAHDSADVWAHPENFLLNEEREPKVVAGVPPDYFSATGQLWGNPIYDWKHHEETGFRWWIDRLKANLVMFDIVRIDHFLGLASYWSVPFKHCTAEHGSWVEAPGMRLLEALQAALGNLPLIAEDLGAVTPEMIALRDKYGLPGMKILQFGFNGDHSSEHLPHSCTRQFVMYTGTHDNDTARGWYKHTSLRNKSQARAYMGAHARHVARAFVRAVWASVADYAIAPLQDILELGHEARMNLPGTTESNWRWRFRKEDITRRLARRLRRLTELCGRSVRVEH